MHELSIARSNIEGPKEAPARHAALTVDAAYLKRGLLSGVPKDALLCSYALASEGAALGGSPRVIEEAPATAWCPSCEVERALTSIQMMCCPVCGAPTPQVTQGRDIELVALEITT